MLMLFFRFELKSQDFNDETRSSSNSKRSYFNVFSKVNFSNYGTREKNNISIGDPGSGDTFTLESSCFLNYELIQHYFSVGAGIIASRTFRPNVNMLALTGEIKGYLSDEINTVFIYLQAGKSFPLADLIINGQHVGIGIGYRFNVGKEILMIDFSSTVKSVQFDGERFNESNDKAWIRGLYFGLGYQF
jgi:hypothetical protein